jgi:hypothetical protein
VSVVVGRVFAWCSNQRLNYAASCEFGEEEAFSVEVPAGQAGARAGRKNPSMATGVPSSACSLLCSLYRACSRAGIDPNRPRWPPSDSTLVHGSDPLSFTLDLHGMISLLRPFPRHQARLIYDPIEGYGGGRRKSTLRRRPQRPLSPAALTTCLESGMDSGNKINCKTCLLSRSFLERLLQYLAEFQAGIFSDSHEDGVHFAGNYRNEEANKQDRKTDGTQKRDGSRFPGSAEQDNHHKSIHIYWTH